MKKITLLSVLFLLSGIISVFGQTTRNYVVLEISTATNCSACPGAAKGVHDLIEKGHKVAVIEHHHSDAYFNEGAKQRVDMYNKHTQGIADPTATFDGNTVTGQCEGGSSTGSMYDSYKPFYEKAIVIESDFTMDMTYVKNGKNIDVTIDIENVGGNTSTNLHAFLFLTESHIPEKWMTETELDFVNRGMYPDKDGTLLDFSGGNSKQLKITITPDDQWDIYKCELVAVIQDMNTKAILQADKESLTVASGTNNAGHLTLTKPSESQCSESFTPVISFGNYGSADATSATIEYAVNGGTKQTYEWTGNLAFNENTSVTLDEISYTLQAKNTLDIEITKINGLIDDDSSDNKLSFSFDKSIESTSAILLTVNYLSHAETNSWTITNSAGTVLAQVKEGTYSERDTYEQRLYLPADCYEFKITDSQNYGGCNFTIIDSDNDTITEMTKHIYSESFVANFSTKQIAPILFALPEENFKIDDKIELVFSEPIRLAGGAEITDFVSLINFKDAAGETVTFTASINADKNTITITPDPALKYETDYEISIAKGAIENTLSMLSESEQKVTFRTKWNLTDVEKLSNSCMKIFPNPSTGIFNITFSEKQKTQITISDISGRTIYSQKSNSQKTEINLSANAKGIYFMEIKNENFQTVKKIILK